MEFKRVSFIVFVIGILIGGCTNLSKAPVVTSTLQPTVTLFPTATPFSTSTPNPTPSPTIKPTFTSESTLISGWFPIPRLTSPETINFSTTRLFKGLKIPPFPDDLIIETAADQPYGEVPPDTIFYQLYLVRQGNRRMLWLGVPFKDTVACCGIDTPHRIYDSIPFPAIDADNLLISFVCTRNQEFDIFLIVVAEHPPKGASATNINYAWRIDQETTSLQSVSTKGIECSPNW